MGADFCVIKPYEIAIETGGVRIVINVREQIRAALLRRDMKRDRRAHGLSTDLKTMVAEYRVICPEYADALERIIYPSARTVVG